MYGMSMVNANKCSTLALAQEEARHKLHLETLYDKDILTED